MHAVPHAKALYARYHEMGVELYALSIDSDLERLEDYLENNDLPWPVVALGGWEGMGTEYECGKGIPRTFVFSPEGEVIWAGHPMSLKDEVMDEIANEYLDANLPSYTYEVVMDEAEVLNDEDPVGERGRFVQTFELELEEGGVYRFYLLSDDFDTFLSVESPSGELAENDDSSDTNFKNSHLTIRESEAGVYTIRATSFVGGRTGAFQLLVERGVIDSDQD